MGLNIAIDHDIVIDCVPLAGGGTVYRFNLDGTLNLLCFRDIIGEK